MKFVAKDYVSAKAKAMKWVEKGYKNILIRTGRSGKLLGRQIVSCRKK